MFLTFVENYVLPNPDEKYDIIPEIWQGHNVADYVDPDIMKVSFSMHTVVCLPDYDYCKDSRFSNLDVVFFTVQCNDATYWSDVKRPPSTIPESAL